MKRIFALVLAAVMLAAVFACIVVRADCEHVYSGAVCTLCGHSRKELVPDADLSAEVVMDNAVYLDANRLLITFSEPVNLVGRIFSAIRYLDPGTMKLKWTSEAYENGKQAMQVYGNLRFDGTNTAIWSYTGNEAAAENTMNAALSGTAWGTEGLGSVIAFCFEGLPDTTNFPDGQTVGYVDSIQSVDGGKMLKATYPNTKDGIYDGAYVVIGGDAWGWSEVAEAVDRNIVLSTSFTFDGNWSVFTAGNYKYARAGNAGDSMSFRFEGTGVRLISNVNWQNKDGERVSLNNTELYARIDGGADFKLNMEKNANPYYSGNAVVYETTGLSEGVHTVTVINKARTSPYGSQSFFHGVQIYNGTMLDPPKNEMSAIYRAIDDELVWGPYYNYAGCEWEYWPGSSCVRSVTSKETPTVTFNFNGEGVNIYANVNVQNGKSYNNDCVYVSIDGGERVEMNVVQDKVNKNVVVYTEKGLAPGDHEVVISVGTKKEALSSNFYFYGAAILNGYIYSNLGVIESLEVTKYPEKIYFGDETELDFDGLELVANGDPEYTIIPLPNTVKCISGATFRDGAYHVKTDAPDTVQTLTLTYQDVEFTIPVTYYATAAVEVSALPKTAYFASDSEITVSGGKLRLTLGVGTEEHPTVDVRMKLSYLTTEFSQIASPGTHTVNGDYFGKAFSYDVYNVIPGDVDGDGDVTVLDLSALVNYAVGAIPLDARALAAAELDGIEGVTMTDATIISKALAAGEQPKRLGRSYISVELPDESELIPDADGVVKITERNVRHIGRTFYNESADGYDFNFNSSGFEIRFTGTRLEAEIESEAYSKDVNKLPIILVFIDGAEDPAKTLKGTARNTLEWFTLAEGLSEGTHTVKILKQNQPAYSHAMITRVRTDGRLENPTLAKDVGFTILGDSIAAGMFNQTEGDSESVYRTEESNSYMAEYSIVARMFGGDFTIFANAGAAANLSAGPVRRDVQVGRTQEDQYKYVDLFWGNDDPYVEEHTRSDVIIINLGTNDNGYINGSKVKIAEFVKVYAELLRYLRARYPDAYIFCTNGVIITNPMDWINEAVEIVKTEDGDERLFTYLETTVARTRHPRVAENITLAGELKEFIASKIS